MAAEAFWKGYLQSASQSLDLVTDQTRTQDSTTAPRHEVQLSSLPDQLWNGGVKDKSITAGNTLLAAFHAYVSRISSQEVVTMGVQPCLLLADADQQQQQQHAPLVPLCCPPVRPEDTISTHAQQLQQQLQLLLPHSHMSLTDICSAAGVQPASSMQHTLFQAGMVVASSVGAAAESAAGLDLVLVLVPQGSKGGSKGGAAAAAGAGSQVFLLYNSGLFTQEGAQLMARHFEVFLAEVLAPGSWRAPAKPLVAAALMDAAEQQQVLRDFNATDLEYDRDAFVHGLFMRRAKETPSAACVVFEDYVFTYAEIDAASNRIANYLVEEAGVTADSIVAVMLLRSPLMIATLLGVLKAGAGYLPLDHHHPEGRIAFMLEDAAVKAVVAQPDLLQKLPDAATLSSLSIHTLLLHPEVAFNATVQGTSQQSKAQARGGAGAGGAAFPPVVPATLAPSSFGAAAGASPIWDRGQLGSPSTTCYIIYTSGSTGKPKGVVVMHQGLTAYIAWFRAFFGITATDVFLQKTPTNFDASMDELWPSLTAGAPLVVAPPEAHRDVHSVMMLITRHSVTTSSAVPSQLQALAREVLALHGPEAAAAGQAPCSSLKQVLSGGEALTTTMAQDISAAMPRCRLFNTYGPTETTVGITAWQYEGAANYQQTDGAPVAATIPIGNGIYNARLYVVDSDFKPVPIGVPGELYISGVQVAWGYLNRPDLNEKTFVPNPFCEGPGTYTDRMYKAGDLVRWLPGRHACLEFLGRVDHQVKLRGFRIELQEIEAALGALPGVSQVATALAKNPTTNQDQLVAWVSPDNLDSQDLVQQLHGMLPEYMIPTVVVRMQQLPLLPSEKVNRKALPPPDFAKDAVRPAVKAAPAKAPAAGAVSQVSSSSGSGSGSSNSSDLSDSPMGSRASSPKMDPLMRFIAGVWANVLGVSADSMGHMSDFFALGGNSLLCGKMNSRIRTGLSVPGLSGMMIYQNASLAEFAQAVAVAGAVLPPGLTVATGSRSSSSTPASFTTMEDDMSSPSRLSSSDLGDLQQYVAEAWAEALGIDANSLGSDDDFFARGGNSLLCGKMNSSLRSGLSLPSMSGMLIYQHPTLAAFTEAVAATGATIPARCRSGSSSPGASNSPSSIDTLGGAVDPIMEADALQDFIAVAWAEALGAEPSSLTADSDFFALGGNSLLCGKMNSRLRVGLNLPGLSGMLIYQNTTLEAFTHAVAQAGPSLPCGGSSCSGASRAYKGSFDSSSFRIGAPAGNMHRVPSSSSTLSGFSGYAGSWTSGLSSSSGGGGSRSAGHSGIASSTANAAAQAAAAAFALDHPFPAGGDWSSMGSASYQESVAAASKAAYAAANAAFTTVMSTLGLDAGYDASASSSSKKKAALDFSSNGIFNKHFRIGAGAAGGSAIPVYNARLQSLPPVPSFGYPAAAGKGSIKPALLKRELPGDEDLHHNHGSQVKPSVLLCTVIQMVGTTFISGAMYGLTVLPMLGWMWLLALWGLKAIPLLPLLNLLSLAAGLVVTVGGKWIFIGRYREGEHPIWGWYYIRHWFAHQFLLAARNSYLPLIKRTTFVNHFYRALGMKVGKNVMIDTDDFQGHDLIDVKDDAVLDMFCGISAVTFEAGKPSDKFPTGKMTIKRASIGKGAVVGAHGMVVCSDVPDGAVVQPCTASNNPPAAWKGSRWPQTGPDAVIAAKSQDKPLGVGSALLAMIITDEVLAIISYPIMFGLLFFWVYLSGYSTDELPSAAADTLVCFIHTPSNPLSAEAAAKCSNLMFAAIKSMLVYPPAIFIIGQLLVLAIIPYKWLVRGRIKPDPALTMTPEPKSWGKRFRVHLMQVMLDHPAMKMYLYMWTGTAMFNAWLRAMGSKVGKQAWIGEGLQLSEHDLVEIGDCVSVCSEVSMLPSTVMGSRKITIKGGADVTNQTCLHPGVTVMPGACLGVFTYAEAERTFPRDSIVQGPMVLRPGCAEPEDGGPPVTEDPAVTRKVSNWQYFKFNAFYTLIMVVLLPLTVQVSTLPFYIASTVIVFKYGILFGALLVPVSWGIGLAIDILWMMAVKKAMLRRCAGNNPFYHYTHTAWMITGILYYFHQMTVLKHISGSQMAVWYYRAMGAKIGKGVLLNSLASNEPDCLTIGDGTVVDDLSFVMAHTVENRCVKFHDVIIGSRVTIGCGSAVLPGCVVNDDAVIGDVSIVMKGETVPSGAVWRGVPAVPVMDQA